ncbi:MAG: ATP-binding protein [Deltaproteobacteria bacterium]|jgi:hypothetical protein|nr:ATP-binding protein [Deltaproteobacteria bacterium]
MEKKDSTDSIAVKNDAAMREIPLGAFGFVDIRRYGDYYIDKTKFLYEIVKRPRPFFLSRPRRFGKTLLLDTLECILSGQQDLFKGLWIGQSDYDWTPYPVIRLNMDEVEGSNLKEIKNSLIELMVDAAKANNEKLDVTTPAKMLKRLIIGLNETHKKKVAVLIDEYDTPIIDNIKNPSMAEKIRVILRKFYRALKTNSKYLCHVFITGVTRFTQLSIFSGLNFLNDITLDEEYAAICGFTAEELEVLLSDRMERTLKGLIEKKSLPPLSDENDLRQLIRDWYDGYSWDGQTRVYNPWSVLSLFQKTKRSNYWLNTGTPDFLRQLAPRFSRNIDWLKNIPPITEDELSIDNIEHLNPAVLMFQAGYLTIKENLGPIKRSAGYSLRVPNLEVQASITPQLFEIDAADDPLEAKNWAKKTRDRLFKLDAPGVEEAFSFYLSQYSATAYTIFESKYQNLLEAALYMADQKFDPQAVTPHGILDFHIDGPNGERFIVELKVYREYVKKSPQAKRTIPTPKSINAPEEDSKIDHIPPPSSEKEIAKLKESMTPLANEALSQIRKQYADKFRADGKPLIMVALVMARRTFVLAKFDVIEPE